PERGSGGARPLKVERNSQYPRRPRERRGLLLSAPARLLAPHPRGGRMAGLMSRASMVVKAKLSKLLDRAEDPAETLDYSYERQLELLQNVKRGIADVVTAKKRIQLQETQLQQNVVKLDAQ